MTKETKQQYIMNTIAALINTEAEHGDAQNSARIAKEAALPHDLVASILEQLAHLNVITQLLGDKGTTFYTITKEQYNRICGYEND